LCRAARRFLVKLLNHIGIEHRLMIITSLNDMQRLSRQNIPGQAGHFAILLAK